MAFGPGSQIYRVGADDSSVLAYERGAGRAYYFDPESGHYVRLAVPNDDRLTGVDYVNPAFAFFGRERAAVAVQPPRIFTPLTTLEVAR